MKLLYNEDIFYKRDNLYGGEHEIERGGSLLFVV